MPRPKLPKTRCTGKDKKHPSLHDVIWASAYGAAFVADFLAGLPYGGFDSALEHANAERAETIADRALSEWIQWNEEGKA